MALWTLNTENQIPGGWDPNVSIGVFGGIPPRTGGQVFNVTASPYNADPNGVNDSYNAITAAINAANNAGSGNIVYFPNGSYRSNNFINLQNKNVTLRGQSREGVVIRSYQAGGGSFILMGTTGMSGSVSVLPGSGSVGIARGNTQVDVSSSSGFAVGQILQFRYPDESALPVFHVSGHPTNQQQVVRITGIVGNRITFQPPIYANYTASGTTCKHSTASNGQSGLENLTINCALAAPRVVDCNYARDCWIKNCHIENGARVLVRVEDSCGLEIRNSYLFAAGNVNEPNNGGIWAYSSSCLWLENNVIGQCAPAVEWNKGCNGCAVTYNYCKDNGEFGIDMNHDPHPRFNLVEGNNTPHYREDGYYGSSSHQTVFRNRIRGRKGNDAAMFYSLILCRAVRNCVFVNNVCGISPGDYYKELGKPNIGSWEFDGTNALWPSDPWVHLKTDLSAGIQANVSVRTSDSQVTATFTGTTLQAFLQHPKLLYGGGASNTGIGVSWGTSTTPQRLNVAVASTTSTTVVLSGGSGTVYPAVGTPLKIWAGQSGFQEWDNGVAPSTTLRGNYNTQFSRIEPAELIAGETYPNSLLYSSAPAFMTGYAWPPFGAEATLLSTRDTVRIPAHQAYIDGDFPEGPSGGDPPTAPSGLIATSASDTQINLAWADNSSTETGFKIYHGTTSGNLTLLATIAANTTTYNHTGLTLGTQHFYRVRATNVYGDSLSTSEANATTSGGSPPLAPSGLTATAVTNSQINLAWIDNSSTETGFKIYRGATSGSLTLLATTSANQTTYNHTGLEAGSTHYYAIRATNTYGDSPPTAQANATTTGGGAAPAAPSGLNAASASSSQINLTWTDNSADETGFKIYHGTTSGNLTFLTTIAAGVTNYAHTGLTAESQHFYQVSATNSFGDSALTTEANATTASGPPPSAPSGLNAVAANDTQINLSWTDNSSDETGFKIYHGTSSGLLALLTTVAANTTAYSHTGLSAGTTHYYRVRATSTGGDSGPTSEDSATTTGTPPPPPPTAPSGLVVTVASDTQIDLTWTDNSSDETGFKIHHGIVSGLLTLLTTTAANATSYSHTGLTPGTTHIYTVRATSASGDSAPTPQDSATTTGGGGPAGQITVSGTLTVGTVTFP